MPRTPNARHRLQERYGCRAKRVTRASERCRNENGRSYCSSVDARVPQVMFVFWFGAPFTGSRLQAYHALRAMVGVPLVLVTENNLHEHILPDAPPHPALPYLTPVHKADYLFACT